MLLRAGRLMSRGAAAIDIVRSGQVAYYKLDEGDGQAVNDSSGCGNHAQLGRSGSPDASDPIWEDGGLTFDNVNDAVLAPHAGILSPASAVSVYAVVKPASFAFATNFGRLVTKDSNDSGEYVMWLYNTSGNAIFYVNHWQNGFATGNVGAAVGQWIALCGTFDGSAAGDRLRIYANGVQKIVAQTSSTAINATSNPLTIGDNVQLARPFHGTIAAVAVYKRTLSASEVARNYAALKRMLAPRGIQLP